MAWQEIESVTLTEAAASVVFDEGLSGFKFFRLTGYIKNGASNNIPRLRFNADTGSNYTDQYIYGNGTSVGGARGTGQSEIDVAPGAIGATQCASFSLVIAKPASGVKAQAVGMTGITDSVPAITSTLLGAEWDNTADALSSLTLLASAGDFDAGSAFLLEGLAL